MSSLAANATKPRRNESRIVDFSQKNLKTELTVTIPQHDLWSSGLKSSDGYWYDVQARSVLAILSENELMQNFASSFDQFKLMDSHFCVDVCKIPRVQFGVKQMWCQRESFEYSMDPNMQQWTPVTEPVGNWLTQEIIDTMLALYPENGMSPVHPNNDDPTIFSNVQGQPFDVELPFVIGASSRRTVPDGFYQTSVGTPFIEPTWDEMMSYGSAIWQARMPGASMHLSLDVAGSSNSERMMTFPSQILNRLYHLKAANQNGRFCPIVYIGCRIKKPSDEELRSHLESMVEHPSIGYYMTDGTKFYFMDGYQYRPINTTDENNAPVTYYLRVKTKYTFTSDGSTKMTPQQFNAVVDKAGVSGQNDYGFTVESYHSVRFKHLRSIVRERAYEYQFVGFRLCDTAWNTTIQNLVYLDTLTPHTGDVDSGDGSWVNFKGAFTATPGTLPTNFIPYMLITYKHDNLSLLTRTYCKLNNGVYEQLDLATLAPKVADATDLIGFTLIGVSAADAYNAFDEVSSIVVFTRDRQPSSRDVILLGSGSKDDLRDGYYRFTCDLRNSNVTLTNVPTPVVNP